jgi:hypothetical protein
LKALRLYKDLQDGRLAAAIEEAVKDELWTKLWNLFWTLWGLWGTANI